MFKECLDSVKENSPLIHNITNYVTVNDVANTILAVGASPIMADVKENTTVVDLEDDVFFIECMECIGIDDHEWNIKEECSNCIFSDKCIKES